MAVAPSLDASDTSAAGPIRDSFAREQISATGVMEERPANSSQ